MYQIYADNTLIYDSATDDCKIGKGSGALELNKAGSFTFMLYPDHFFYDSIVKMRTVIKVMKSGKILFRGRALKDQCDKLKRKTITCEGELNFLCDSIIRPFEFTGTPEELFVRFITDHNSQVDDFKKFKIGKVTVYDPNDYIARSNSGYVNTLKNMTSRLIDDSLGGYFYITHGDDGAEDVPTIHYLADLPNIASQQIEFGSNLLDFLKKTDASPVATAIIPLGAQSESGERLTISDINDGLDYICDPVAVEAYGWICQPVTWDDVSIAANLKARAEAYLADLVKTSVTLQLNALDLHMLDRSIDSYGCGDYVRCISPPHNFAETLLCNKQTFDLLLPNNDTITLGASSGSFVASAARSTEMAASAAEVKQDVSRLDRKTSAYKIAEQQFTNLLAQSFGVFRTEEVLTDGSTVYYLHDKPTLAGSTNIWKMTGDAFAVSSDGGETWNAGIDTSGNAIMNVLSVVGLDASWINTDNLTAISANIGGWVIKDNAFYKVHQDSTTGYYYRVYIRPPDKRFYSSDDYPFIEIEESVDRISYHRVMTLEHFSVKFWNYDGNELWHFAQYGATSAILQDRSTGNTIDLSQNYITVKNALGVGSTITPTSLSVSSLTGKSTTITIGNIRMTFVGGILVNAVNV